VVSRIPLSKRVEVEWFTWVSLAFVSALLEGGIIGVIIKNGFEGQVNNWWLNISVAIATGAPFFSNLSSFYWVKASRGKSKANYVSKLAVVFCICCFLMGFVSFDDKGLIAFLLLIIVARLAWSGILTIRSNIWRANYPRHIRGKVTAKLTTLASLVMAVCGALIGWLLDWNIDLFKWIFFGLASISFFGAYRYRGLAVRHQQKEIISERDSKQKTTIWKSFTLLKDNRQFGKYMLAMFTLGSGNLMFMAPLIVYFNEHTTIDQLQQIIITTAIPLALIPIAVGWWARLLDKNHIFHFRSIHSWCFVLALMIFVVAQILSMTWIYYFASLVYGIAISGGVIGWNLGHNDFVNADTKSQNKPKENPMDYMAVHVTLTGLRGLIMPLVGILFYQWLTSIDSNYGQYALLLPFSITLMGAVLFVVFNRHQKPL